MNLLKKSWIGFVQAIDSDYFPEGAEAARQAPEKLEVGRAIPFLILHLGCLGVIWAGWSWTAVAVAVALYFGRMFAVTAFYHRYFCHRAFRTSRALQFVLGLVGLTSVQRGPLWWAAVHRHHHAHSDEEHDAHSPRWKGFFWSHIGWLTSSRNFPTDYNKVKDLATFPELVFLNRFDLIGPALLIGAHIPGAHVSTGCGIRWIKPQSLASWAPGIQASSDLPPGRQRSPTPARRSIPWRERTGGDDYSLSSSANRSLLRGMPPS